jgi:hypothetical protein
MLQTSRLRGKIKPHYHCQRNPELYSILTNYLAQAVAIPTLNVSTRADATLAEANARARTRVDTAATWTIVAHVADVPYSQNLLMTLFAFAMESFEYLAGYRILMCQLCKYAVSCHWLQPHLRHRQKEDHDDLHS